MFHRPGARNKNVTAPQIYCDVLFICWTKNGYSAFQQQQQQQQQRQQQILHVPSPVLPEIEDTVNDLMNSNSANKKDSNGKNKKNKLHARSNASSMSERPRFVLVGRNVSPSN